MAPIKNTSPVMILAAAGLGEQWLDLLATSNRTVTLFTNHSDLLYQIAQIEPALIIIDDQSAGCSPELLSVRISQRDMAMPPATLVVANSNRAAALTVELDGIPFDYLPADCEPSMLQAKVSFLLRMQRQQQLFYSSLRELDRVNHQHQQLLNATADGILGLDWQGVIRFANAAAGDLLLCDCDQLLGRNYRALLQPGWSDSTTQDEQSFHPVHSEDQVFFRVDGRAFPVACRPGAVNGDSEVTSVVLFEDISARKELEAALRRRAEQDPLTGLANRATFTDFLNGALSRARRSDKQVGLLYLDLDGFKQINDRLGHHIGDQLLKGVSRRLVSAVRTGDLVARMGGDEFVVVLDDVAGEQGCRAAAQTIASVLSVPHRINNAEISCVPSIGIATFPIDGEDEVSLLAASDQAMYREKQGRDQQVA